MEKFGHSEANVRFVKGYIEKLDEAGLEDDTFDIIVYVDGIPGASMRSSIMLFFSKYI